MKTTSIALLGLAASAMGMSAPATAQDSGTYLDGRGYLGAAIGQAKFKKSCSGLTGVGFAGSCDEKDTAWKVFGGYQAHRYFGLELGYTDLGETSAAGTIAGVPVSAAIEAKGIELTVVGTVPLGDRFSAYAKVGAFRWDVDARATVGAVTTSTDDKGTNFTYGFGLNFHVNPNIAVRAEWQRYNDVGDSSTTGRGDVNMVSAGVLFKF